MIKLTVGEICAITGGKANCDLNLTVLEAPVFDSRKVKAGSFFLALKGENQDGHDFIGDAISNGAIFALTSKSVSEPAVLVDDVLLALGKLAAYVRSQLNNLIVIGITGSQGKTTTKELLRHLLSQSGNTVAPEGSFNNELGAPLTLLNCTENTKYCIVELGARHKGDIEKLAKIVRPSIGVVLTVGTAHIGEFGSRLKIAETKGELINTLPSNGIAILGTYDDLTPTLAKNFAGKVITFGESAEIRASDIESREGHPHFDLVTPETRVSVALKLIGLHQVPNALAAASVGFALGIPTEKIATALSTAEQSSKWRMELHELPGLLVINDSYNANPESMTAALKTLTLFAQERGGSAWAFLGTMHELGNSSDEEHKKIGKVCIENEIDYLISINQPNYGGILVPNKEAALKYVPEIAPGDVVLVKASRAEGLEELASGIISAWLERGEN